MNYKKLSDVNNRSNYEYNRVETSSSREFQPRVQENFVGYMKNHGRNDGTHE